MESEAAVLGKGAEGGVEVELQVDEGQRQVVGREGVERVFRVVCGIGERGVGAEDAGGEQVRVGGEHGFCLCGEAEVGDESLGDAGGGADGSFCPEVRVGGAHFGGAAFVEVAERGAAGEDGGLLVVGLVVVGEAEGAVYLRLEAIGEGQTAGVGGDGQRASAAAREDGPSVARRVPARRGEQVGDERVLSVALVSADGEDAHFSPGGGVLFRE